MKNKKELKTSIQKVIEYLNSNKCRIPNEVLFDFWRVVNYSESAIQRDESIIALGKAIQSLGLFKDYEDKINSHEDRINSIELEMNPQDYV